MLNVRHDKTMYKLFCTSKTTVQIDCTDQSLHGVRYDGISFSSAGVFLAFAQQQEISEIQFPRTESQRRFTDDTRAKLGQISLRKGRIMAEQKFAAHNLKDRIS